MRGRVQVVLGARRCLFLRQNSSRCQGEFDCWGLRRLLRTGKLFGGTDVVQGVRQGLPFSSYIGKAAHQFALGVSTSAVRAVTIDAITEDLVQRGDENYQMPVCHASC